MVGGSGSLGCVLRCYVFPWAFPFVLSPPYWGFLAVIKLLWFVILSLYWLTDTSETQQKYFLSLSYSAQCFVYSCARVTKPLATEIK